MTAFGSVETAVEAMKHGASDYLTKPVKKDDLVRVIERVVREASLRREVSRLRKKCIRNTAFIRSWERVRRSKGSSISFAE